MRKCSIGTKDARAIRQGHHDRAAHGWVKYAGPGHIQRREEGSGLKGKPGEACDDLNNQCHTEAKYGWFPGVTPFAEEEDEKEDEPEMEGNV